MPSPSLVLLAAGASRRYGRPKQLDPVGPAGRTIMELTARDAVGAGVDRIVLVVNSDTGAEVVRRMRRAVRRDGHAASVSVEGVEQRLDDLPTGFTRPPDPAGSGRTRPWGTAHALWSARSALADSRAPGESRAPVVVANADDWYGPDAIRRIVTRAAAADVPEFAALVPYPLGVTLPPPSISRPGGVSRGMLGVDASGRLEHIQEVLDIRHDPDEPGMARGRKAEGAGDDPDVEIPVDELCSMNLWALGPAIWDVLEHRFERFLAVHASDPRAEWFLPDVVLAAAADGALAVEVLEPGRVHLGITHPADRERVREGLRTALRAR